MLVTDYLSSIRIYFFVFPSLIQDIYWFISETVWLKGRLVNSLCAVGKVGSIATQFVCEMFMATWQRSKLLAIISNKRITFLFQNTKNFLQEKQKYLFLCYLHSSLYILRQHSALFTLFLKFIAIFRPKVSRANDCVIKTAVGGRATCKQHLKTCDK